MIMRKLCLSACMICLVLTSIQAQKKTPKVAVGYKGMAEAGMTFASEPEIADYDFSTTHGYQVNPYLFLGVGMGYSMDSEGDYHSLPIYAAVRGNFPLGGRLFPFANARLGYSIDGLEGLYFNPGLGVSYMFSARLGLDFTLGYTLQKNTVSIWGSSITMSTNAFSFRVGLQF